MRKISLLLILCIFMLTVVGCSADTAENHEIADEVMVKYKIIKACDFYDGNASILLEETLSERQVFAIIDTEGNVITSDLNGFTRWDGEVFYANTDEAECSDGFFLIPTISDSDERYFSLINSSGKVIYDYHLKEDEYFPDFDVVCIGKGCFEFYNSSTGETIYLSGHNGGKYNFIYNEDSESEFVSIGDGYIIQKSHVKNFSEDSIYYYIYNYTGKEIKTELTPQELQDLYELYDRYMGCGVVSWSKDNTWFFYNIENPCKFEIDEYTYLNERKYDTRSFRRRLYGGYDETGHLLLCESFVDYENRDSNTMEVFSVDTKGDKSSIVKISFDGSVFTNYGEYFINEFDGAIVGNDDYTAFSYCHFDTGEIVDLCKNYPGKEANQIWCINKSLIGFRVEGSDEEQYGALVDLFGNPVVEPTKDADFKEIGPWIGVRFDSNTVYKYYDENGTMVYDDDYLLGYGDERFTTSDNYVMLDGNYLFSLDCYYDENLVLKN